MGVKTLYITPKNHRLRVFESMVLRKISERERDEMGGECDTRGGEERCVQRLVWETEQ